MLTFLIVIIGLSLLILGHEAGHFLVAKMFGMKIDEFGIGFPPRIKAWQKGETAYSINWLPFGGFVKIAGEDGGGQTVLEPQDKKRYFFAQNAWRRAAVIAAGVIMNFVFGWLLISAVYMAGTPPILAIREVAPNSPAAAAGIKAGDLLKDFKTGNDFINFIGSHPQDAARFTVIRGGEEMQFAIVPQSRNGTPRIGVALEEGGAPRMPALSALGQGFMASLQICRLTVTAFYELIKNLILHASLLEGVVGPVGIFSVANETSGFGLAYLFEMLALISLNLAVINLVPFPALDGGRLFLILVEKIKGSPISKKVEGAINSVGFAFLILLMALVTVRDVAHWFN